MHVYLLQYTIYSHPHEMCSNRQLKTHHCTYPQIAGIHSRLIYLTDTLKGDFYGNNNHSARSNP